MSESPAALLVKSDGTEIATASNPVRIDPTGATTQPVSGPLTDTQLRATAVPVSGTVTASGPLTDTQLRASAVPVSGPLTDTQLRATAVSVSAAALPLPSGAATSALQTTGNTSVGNIDTKIPALGQSLMAASIPVVIASNQSAVAVSGAVTANAGTGPFPVSDNGGSLTVDGTVGVSGSVSVTGPLTDTQLRASAVPVTGGLTDTQLRASAVPVSATALPLPAGAATSALQTTGNASVGSIDTKTPALGQALMAASSPVVIASNQSAVPISATALPLPTGASTETTLAAASAKLPATLGQKAMTASMAVVLASDQSTVPVKEIRSTTSAVTSVAGAASDTVLLAVNANRLGATIYNDSSANLYMKLGTGASTTSFTVRMAAQSYYELPAGYTGAVNGRWGSATGDARITELT
jgi:hypothetical protein